MIDDEFRRHLAALCREYDKFSAECDDWLAQRTPPASPVSETGDHGLIYRDHSADALYGVPAAPETDAIDEGPCFTELQMDTLATVIAELRREFEESVERAQQRMLQMAARLAMPGERAEETAYALKDRVALMEGRIERQLSEIVERRFKEATTDTILDLPNFIRRRSDAA